MDGSTSPRTVPGLGGSNPPASQQLAPQQRKAPPPPSDPPPRRDPLTSSSRAVLPPRRGLTPTVATSSALSMASGGGELGSLAQASLTLSPSLDPSSLQQASRGTGHRHASLRGAAQTVMASQQLQRGIMGDEDTDGVGRSGLGLRSGPSFPSSFQSQMLAPPTPLDTHVTGVGDSGPFAPMPGRHLVSVASTQPTDLSLASEAVVKVKTLRQANNIPQSTGVMSPFLKGVWSVVKFIFRDLLSLRLGFLKIQYPFSKHKLANAFVIGLRLVVSAAIATGVITSIVLTAGASLSIAGGIFLGVLGAAFLAGWAFEARSYTKYNQRMKADQIMNQSFPNDDAHRKLNDYRQKLAQLEADRTQYASAVKESENAWRAAMSRSDFDAKREELEIELLKAHDEIQQSGIFAASQIGTSYADSDTIGAYVGQITQLLNESQNPKISNSITGFTSALQRCFTLFEAKKGGHGTDKDVVEVETLTNSEGLVALLNRFMANPKDVTKEIIAVADRLNRLT